MTSALIRREEGTDKRKGHIKMKAESRGMQPQTKECDGYQKLEEAKKDPLLRPPKGAWPY